MQSIAEAVGLGSGLGLPRDLLLDTLAKTAVVAPAHAGKLATAKRNDYAPEFPIRLMYKDFGLVLTAAAQCGLSMGDEAFSGLLEFADKYHVASAHFTAIGALNRATVGWFDPQQNVQEDPHRWPARSDWDKRRYRALSRKARSAYAHRGWESRRDNACRSCSRRIRIANAGSDGYGGPGSDA